MTIPSMQDCTPERRDWDHQSCLESALEFENRHGVDFRIFDWNVWPLIRTNVTIGAVGNAQQRTGIAR